MASLQRRRRLEDQIQREISEILRLELRDPRVGLVTISGVELSSDLAFAKIYYTLIQQSGFSADQVQKVLKGASGFFRLALGKRLTIRVVPEIRFVYDRSIEEGIRMASLIDQALEGGDGSPNKS
jgi:ribosome-binding factor A